MRYQEKVINYLSQILANNCVICYCGGNFSDWHSHASGCPAIDGHIFFSRPPDYHLQIEEKRNE